MRWLQWSTGDLEHGLGGVETHARSLARELRALGHEVVFSKNARDLSEKSWDVVHTHGSSIPALPLRAGGRIRIHTLHGTTLGRMAACHEWRWSGGYFAALRENVGVLEADLVLTVNPELWLARLASNLGKRVVNCENGWDAVSAPEELSAATLARLPVDEKYWVFVGRGDDRVKAVDQIQEALRRRKDLKLVAAPGTGFEDAPEVIQTGRLNPGQVLSLLDRSAGLLIPSRYEGNSLAILEALSRGVPVVATPVGASPAYRERSEGLVLAASAGAEDILVAIRTAEQLDLRREGRGARAEHNQNALPKWRQVAETAIDAVERLRTERGLR